LALHNQTNTTRSTRTLDFRSQNTYNRVLESFLDSSTKGNFTTRKFAMFSEKVDYSRRSIMLKVAAEAPAVRASETDDLENSSWPFKHAFFGNFPAVSNDGRPCTNAEAGSEPYLWLADTYDTLPEWDTAY
jgi:hypothetical protein